jgi:futalosine hydrolase
LQCNACPLPSIYDLRPMKVVITSATDKETELVKQNLRLLPSRQNDGLELVFHLSGIGLLSSSFSIAELIFMHKPDLIVQAGIAGTFDDSKILGEVVVVKDEIPGDIGVEENGIFKDLFDLHLQSEPLFPFVGRKLTNPFLPDFNYLQLEEVTGISISEITTRPDRIEALKAKYRPVVESMEGAALHYCCLRTSTPFIQIRAISNFVGERDKSKWNFKDALHNIADVLTRYIEHLQTIKLKEEK